MHDFAQRGVASHWQYKSSEKFNSLSWKEYDWLKDLVEIIEKNENPEDSYEYTKLQMFHGTFEVLYTHKSPRDFHFFQ